jgi:hypothetical protein
MLATIRSISRSLMPCLALGMMSVSAPAEPAHEFSAEIVSRDAAGLATGPAARLYAANGKVRIETPAVPAGFFLIDRDTGTALFVRAAQKVFMSAKQSTALTQIFVPVDPNDPCRQWQAASDDAGVPSHGDDWHCQRIGTSIVAGRGATEYRLVAPQEQSSQRWVDAELDFPMKLRAADGTTISLEHIRVEAQPMSLFAVPPEYRRLEPQALIDRIKHSDVWVDSPN